MKHYKCLIIPLLVVTFFSCQENSDTVTLEGMALENAILDSQDFADFVDASNKLDAVSIKTDFSKIKIAKTLEEARVHAQEFMNKTEEIISDQSLSNVEKDKLLDEVSKSLMGSSFLEYRKATEKEMSELIDCTKKLHARFPQLKENPEVLRKLTALVKK